MKVNKLQVDQIDIMGGATEILQFEVRDSSGELFDLVGSRVIWTMCTIGDKENPLVKKDSENIGGITIQEKGLCVVEIEKEDTEMLHDIKVEHELIVEQLNGKVLRPCYGYIYIKQGSIYN